MLKIDEIVQMTTIENLDEWGAKTKKKFPSANENHVKVIRGTLLQYVKNHRRLVLYDLKTAPPIVYVGRHSCDLYRMMNLSTMRELIKCPSRFTLKQGMGIIIRLFWYHTKHHRMQRTPRRLILRRAANYRVTPHVKPWIKRWTPSEERRTV